MIEQDIEIVFNRRVAANTFFMGLRSPKIVSEARPGQFVMLKVGRGMDPLLRRPFSICGIREDDLVLILYRVVGQGTAIMSDAMERESLSVLGPLGSGFEIPQRGEKPILVSGGMGIAPLIFLASIMEPGSFTFLAGFGSAKEIVATDEIGSSGLDLSISTDDGSSGHRGLVTELLENRLAGFNGNIKPVVFSCGPLPMLKEVAAITLYKDVPCQVSLEASMACGLGACQGCAIRRSSEQAIAYYHVCQDGPVFDVKDLDWGVL
ncbi:MAG: dihydroorotate dehydrogenase electron transfer subunit [Desulfobacteraceae bacterium]|nr:dihydroorotate dehydrogenase electron transfer subunit [Desulfobacteraceae bacterium]